MFLHWGTNNPGMQSNGRMQGWRLYLAKQVWVGMSKLACVSAWLLDKLGAHKQWANRMLEPWQFITVIFTITTDKMEKIYELRDHEAAMPEFRALVREMRIMQELHRPRDVSMYSCDNGMGWHLPYVELEERKGTPVRDLIRYSAARCARVSYNNHDGTRPDHAKDIDLYNRLVGSDPQHASPTEHQAFPACVGPVSFANFTGWINHRYQLENPAFKQGLA